MTDSMQSVNDTFPHHLPAAAGLASTDIPVPIKSPAATRNRAKPGSVPRIRSRNPAPRRSSPPKKSRATKLSLESSEEPGWTSHSEDNCSSPSFGTGSGTISSVSSKDLSRDVVVSPRSFLAIPNDEMASATVNPSSPGAYSARDVSSVSMGQDFDLEDLCRKKGLKRVLAVIQDDENTETEVEKMPEALFTKEAMAQVFDQGKKLVTSIERLQRFFNSMKEKLYRARCTGMDQGIEDVLRGVSPFLEQHMQKINKNYQEELTKAKDVRELRIKSINLEYETSIRAIWDSIELELERKQRVQKVKIVEKMIKSECDLMHGQLRHACTRWKDGLNKGGPAPKTVNGISINTGTEASIEESAADLWKLMKISIRQKYYDKYLSPEAESRTAEQERAARNQLIQKLLFDNQQGNGNNGEPPKTVNAPKNGTRKRKAMTKGTASKNDGAAGNMVIEEFQEQVLQLDMLADGADLPGVQISIPDSLSVSNIHMSAEFF